MNMLRIGIGICFGRGTCIDPVEYEWHDALLDACIFFIHPTTCRAVVTKDTLRIGKGIRSDLRDTKHNRKSRWASCPARRQANCRKTHNAHDPKYTPSAEAWMSPGRRASTDA